MVCDELQLYVCVYVSVCVFHANGCFPVCRWSRRAEQWSSSPIESTTGSCIYRQWVCRRVCLSVYMRCCYVERVLGYEMSRKQAMPMFLVLSRQLPHSLFNSALIHTAVAAFVINLTPFISFPFLLCSLLYSHSLYSLISYPYPYRILSLHPISLSFLPCPFIFLSVPFFPFLFSSDDLLSFLFLVSSLFGSRLCSLSSPGSVHLYVLDLGGLYWHSSHDHHCPVP